MRSGPVRDNTVTEPLHYLCFDEPRYSPLNQGYQERFTVSYYRRLANLKSIPHISLILLIYRLQGKLGRLLDLSPEKSLNHTQALPAIRDFQLLDVCWGI